MEVRPCKITLIDLHHSAGHEKNTEEIRQYHMNVRGYGDIGYNAVIESDGKVGKGRDVYYSGANDPGLAPDGSGYTMNQRAYGLCHIGNFQSPYADTMSDVQFNASVKYCAEKCKEFGIVPSKATIKEHKNQFATECPGDTFPYEKYVSEVIELFNGNGGEQYMKNLVSYFGDGDREIALDFSIYLGCPLILASQVTDELSNAVSGQKYQVGGASAPSGFKLLAGNDRFDTKIEVLKEMGKI